MRVPGEAIRGRLWSPSSPLVLAGVSLQQVGTEDTSLPTIRSGNILPQPPSTGAPRVRLWRPIGPLGLCTSLKTELLGPLPNHHRAALLVPKSRTGAVKGPAGTITHPVTDSTVPQAGPPQKQIAFSVFLRRHCQPQVVRSLKGRCQLLRQPCPNTLFHLETFPFQAVSLKRFF